MKPALNDQKTTLSRRQFLKIVGFGGVALMAGLRLGQTSEFSKNSEVSTAQADVLRETHLLMDSVVSLALVGTDLLTAKQASAECLRAMRQQVDLFNRFDPNSQLSRLNASGRLKKPDARLVTLLDQAGRISQACAGAFDISILPVLELYLATQASGGRLPAFDELRSHLRLVDYKKIAYDLDEIGLSTPGMRLTLDGIAKGAVVDAGVAALRAHGFKNVIVEAAGDLLAAGERDLQVPWKIGIRPPRPDMLQKLPVLHIKNAAVATSGDYLQAFTPDYSSYHILDPRRGASSSELCSATVVAPSASLADGLATALMVLGRREGLELLKSFPGSEAYLIDKDLQASHSPGMHAYSSDIL